VNLFPLIATRENYFIKKIIKTMTKLILIFPLMLLGFSSCKKDPVEEINNPSTNQNTNNANDTAKGTVKLYFEHVADNLPFALDTSNYVTPNQDTFSVNTFKYYISNIKLLKADGTFFSETDSYHLIDESLVGSKSITIQNVPKGTYTGIRFMIGVDSARNVSGSQTGALDPINGMFWSWNSGYIMAKMEGTYIDSSSTKKSLFYHVGGFSGSNSVVKTVSPGFNGATASVSTGLSPEIHLKCNVMEWFRTPKPINLNVLHTIHMQGTNAKLIADNYADMFTVDHIHN